MGLYLANYEQTAHAAVKAFWRQRAKARARQAARGKQDQGERAAVTGGRNMDAFLHLMEDLTRGNGLERATLHLQRRALTLPGFFRPTKLWDMLILDGDTLIAALEFKSQVGPSFGNNFNNRAEEAIGTAHDFWTAYRERAFGDIPRPFLGWLTLVEDAPDRYHVLCQKLVREQLYTSATCLASPRTALKNGLFTCKDDMTSLNSFVTSFAGHIAAAAARPRG